MATWLTLLDRLYAQIEGGGFESLHGAPGTTADTRDGAGDWPPDWQGLIAEWAARIGASEVRLTRPRRREAHPLPTETRGARRVLRAHAPEANRSPATPWPTLVAHSAAASGFSEGQQREFHAFCHHFYAALALQAQLQRAQHQVRALHEALDAWPMGLIVLDEALEVVWLNAPARQLLARGDRLALRGRRLQGVAEPAVLDDALAGCAACAAQPRAEPRHVSFAGLDLRVQALPPTALASRPGQGWNEHIGALQPSAPRPQLLLGLHVPCTASRLREVADLPDALAQQLQRRYRLTEKEMPLAWNLALGMSLKQYAAQASRSVETVRAQLKSVLRKLGASEQRGIGAVLFELGQTLALQALGQQLAAAVPEQPMAMPQGRAPRPPRRGTP